MKITEKDFQMAVDEIHTEIIMRKNMLDKSFDEKKVRYWGNRVEKMYDVLEVLIQLGVLRGWKPRNRNDVKRV